MSLLGRAWLRGVLLFVVPAICQAQGSSGAPSTFERRKPDRCSAITCPAGCHKLNGEGGTIGPDLTTVRQRRSAAYVVAMIADPQRIVPGSIMPRPRMPESTRDLITRYLVSQPGDVKALHRPQPRRHPGRAGRIGAVREVVRRVPCATGRSDGPNAPDLPVKPAAHASREAMSARPDDSLFDTIAAGGAVMNRSPRMPAFGATLSAAEIRALVRHIRSLCQCEGPPWSRNP
jgi:mono/diheme cytochrome c family protein